jgi:hypothetical protein
MYRLQPPADIDGHVVHFPPRFREGEEVAGAVLPDGYRGPELLPRGPGKGDPRHPHDPAHEGRAVDPRPRIFPAVAVGNALGGLGHPPEPGFPRVLRLRQREVPQEKDRQKGESLHPSSFQGARVLTGRIPRTHEKTAATSRSGSPESRAAAPRVSTSSFSERRPSRTQAQRATAWRTSRSASSRGGWRA